MNCIFCKMVSREIPASIVFEDEEILAFNDIHPLAPVHVLIIPKRHIASIDNIEAGDAELIGKMVLVAKRISQDLQIAEKGYKLLFRVGEYGGQEVKHIHLHLIGGAQLFEDIHPIEQAE